MKLTKESIKKLMLPQGKPDAIYFDDDLKGFGIRLRAGGKKTWVAQYRFGIKQKRVTLGTVKLKDHGGGTLDVEDAREAARNILARVTLGGDPQADKQKARAQAAITIGSLVDQYLTLKEPALRPNSYRASKLYLKTHWRTLHGLPIHEVSRRDVAARLSELASANGPVAARGARTTLSSFLGWCVREGLCENNVVIGTNEPAQPEPRDRILSGSELFEIWQQCQDNAYGRIVKLLLLTAARRNEVGAMAWSELDLDQCIWRIPASRTKNHEEHVLPLPRAALEIIKVVEHRDVNDRLFGETMNGFNGWAASKRKLDCRILDARRKATVRAYKPVEQVKPMAPWRLHDIRRSAATHMAELGVLPHIVEAVLNHTGGHKAGVAGVYNHARYEREMKAALALWAGNVLSLASGREPRVVLLRRN